MSPAERLRWLPTLLAPRRPAIPDSPRETCVRRQSLDDGRLVRRRLATAGCRGQAGEHESVRAGRSAPLAVRGRRGPRLRSTPTRRRRAGGGTAGVQRRWGSVPANAARRICRTPSRVTGKGWVGVRHGERCDQIDMPAPLLRGAAATAGAPSARQPPKGTRRIVGPRGAPSADMAAAAPGAL